jgi:hypothetical protein
MSYALKNTVFSIQKKGERRRIQPSPHDIKEIKTKNAAPEGAAFDC